MQHNSKKKIMLDRIRSFKFLPVTYVIIHIRSLLCDTTIHVKSLPVTSPNNVHVNNVYIYSSIGSQRSS